MFSIKVGGNARWSLFVYTVDVRGVKYGELGITSAMDHTVKNRERRVNDEVLEMLLTELTAGDMPEMARDWKL